MKVLVDTCTFLWIILDDPRLSDTARKEFAKPGNDTWLSAASACEVAIKYRLGRLPLPEDPVTYVPKQRHAHGIQPLPLREEECLQLARLPDIHRDPFDRMLVCQAIVQGLTLLTPDPEIHKYPVRAIW